MTAIVAMAALVIAVLAFAHARRTARKLSMLEEQYWQLKFDHGELKAKVDPAGAESKPNFIPLIRLRPDPAQAASGASPATSSGPSRAPSRDGETGSS
jgi:hypothetical protein